jgi:hypothetical protein
MFGLASLQMAQSLRTHISSVHLGGPGLQVPDASSSYLAPSASKGVTPFKYNGGRSGSSSSGSGGRAGTGAESSAKSSSGAPSTGKRQNDTEHTFTWRDFFDIVVKWRQVRRPWFHIVITRYFTAIHILQPLFVTLAPFLHPPLSPILSIIFSLPHPLTL